MLLTTCGHYCELFRGRGRRRRRWSRPAKRRALTYPGQTTFSTSQHNIQSKTIVLALSHGIDDKVVTGRLQFYRWSVQGARVSCCGSFENLFFNDRNETSDDQRWRLSTAVAGVKSQQSILKNILFFLSQRRSRPFDPSYLRRDIGFFFLYLLLLLLFTFPYVE